MAGRRRAGGIGRKEGTYGTHGTYATGSLRNGPAAQNQELRGIGCWPIATATMGGEVRLPRFVPLWPALSHRVFFFGEGKGCPTLRGVSTRGACARPLFYGEAALRGWHGDWLGRWTRSGCCACPPSLSSYGGRFAKRAQARFAKRGRAGKGRMGGRGWQTTRHDPGVFYFFVFARAAVPPSLSKSYGGQAAQKSRVRDGRFAEENGVSAKRKTLGVWTVLLFLVAVCHFHGGKFPKWCRGIRLPGNRGGNTPYDCYGGRTRVIDRRDRCRFTAAVARGK
ncbi:MAG: hypothetical protein JWR26_4872 [Pedosphaera sp.]|nr:hypothetical protein [Pedosphaera sp.]